LTTSIALLHLGLRTALVLEAEQSASVRFRVGVDIAIHSEIVPATNAKPVKIYAPA
jgi:hypothetical protein